MSDSRDHIVEFFVGIIMVFLILIVGHFSFDEFFKIVATIVGKFEFSLFVDVEVYLGPKLHSIFGMILRIWLRPIFKINFGISKSGSYFFPFFVFGISLPLFLINIVS